MQSFRKQDLGASENRGVPYFGVLTIRILLFRVLYEGPLFSETPIWLFLMWLLGPTLSGAPAAAVGDVEQGALIFWL